MTPSSIVNTLPDEQPKDDNPSSFTGKLDKIITNQAVLSTDMKNLTKIVDEEVKPKLDRINDTVVVHGEDIKKLKKAVYSKAANEDELVKIMMADKDKDRSYNYKVLALIVGVVATVVGLIVTLGGYLLKVGG